MSILVPLHAAGRASSAFAGSRGSLGMTMTIIIMTTPRGASG